MMRESIASDPDLAIAAAAEIADVLLAHSVRDAANGITWNRGFDLRRRAAPDSGLYNGRCGEAFFFAHLFAATGDEQYRESALAAFSGVLASCEIPAAREQLVKSVSLGLNGVGAMVYALASCATPLEAPELIESAAALALAVNDSAVESDARLEVTWGVAGALLGLLPLADRGSTSALRMAQRCGDRLLDQSVRDDAIGGRNWMTGAQHVAPDGALCDIGQPTSGFAHGSTGIAHALLELSRRTNDLRFREAAHEAFAFERSLYRPDLEAWPDFPGQDERAIRNAWCHGAVGIGLSRVWAISDEQSRDLEALRQDLQWCYRAANKSVRGVESLCCGLAGRVDFLIEAVRLLGDRESLDTARTLGDALVRQLDMRGYRADFAADRQPFGPGLWQGAAGIGYLLLRLARPTEVPCVLVMGNEGTAKASWVNSTANGRHEQMVT